MAKRASCGDVELTPHIEPKAANWRSKDLMTYQCATCMIQFIVPIRLAEQIAENDELMYCPNGHAHAVPTGRHR
jgi:hypothetical protein